ncbi:MAG: CAP domain-containing protein [Corynebacterium sp.]|uniref:CAP domain-containing protein n=1 Tax=Corynebacterium sp. TaxID=1720 RepID=UPI0026E0E620|nr:CAP domain-containing protein [Corynebacterium sp.]MDO5670449.1 CAP domain-containing protein [Corynebacterium sp.]
MRFRRTATVALALALVAPATAVHATPATAFPLFGSSSPLAGPASSQSDIQEQLLTETNRFRLSRGLTPLAAHETLDDVAQSWSESMARHGDMKHNPSYLSRYPDSWRAAAENVGFYSREVAARDMVQAWVNSPSHRRNLENPNFTHLGVGWATNPAGEVYATQNFASF